MGTGPSGAVTSSATPASRASGAIMSAMTRATSVRST